MTDSNKIIQWIAVVLGLIIAVAVVPQILYSSTGVVGPTMFLAGLGGAYVAIIYPKYGLYIAAFEVIYLDYFKKLAVYYGEVSMLTIMQVLIVSMITIGCVYLGVLLKYIFGHIELTKWDFRLFIASVFLCLINILIGYKTEGSMAQSIQTAINLTIYSGLVVVMPIILRKQKNLDVFLRFVAACFIPWSIYGIYQYFFGFNKMEWFYAETGLSPVSSNQFFAGIMMSGEAKVMGFASGAANFGCIGFMLPLSLWMTVFTKQRIFWGAVCIFLLAAMIVSLQRSALLTPLIGVAFFFFTKNWSRVIIGYVATFTLLIIGIANATYLLDKLDDINDTIATEGRWGSTVLKVGTFSDRLRGWEKFSDPATYTFLGTLGGEPEKPASHDVINYILAKTGVVGLLVFIGVTFATGYYIHYTTFQIQDKRRRSLARMLIAAMVPMFITGMFGGSNFHTNPLNFIIWTHLGAIYCLICYDREARSSVRSKSEVPGDISLALPAH